jgi:hypothetical protein
VSYLSCHESSRVESLEGVPTDVLLPSAIAPREVAKEFVAGRLPRGWVLAVVVDFEGCEEVLGLREGELSVLGLRRLLQEVELPRVAPLGGSLNGWDSWNDDHAVFFAGEVNEIVLPLMPRIGSSSRGSSSRVRSSRGRSSRCTRRKYVRSALFGMRLDPFVPRLFP